ncbi:MAG: hypothetical protein KatS3mg077_0662 [Candidatus Binatia bacterium]|nr:MAG: hypothetical protein KatS3mg077_0662 [Candidatus Binatia bacterium]
MRKVAKRAVQFRVIWGAIVLWGLHVPAVSLALQAGPLTPAACTNQFFFGSSASWSQPNSAGASDNSYATANFGSTTDGAYTSWLFCSQYGFSLPSNAVVQGIQVDVERRQGAAGATGVDKSVKTGLGSAQSADRASVDPWPSVDTVKTYGGPTDLWGRTWSPADINASTFGVAIAGAQSGATPPQLLVDSIQVTVFYSVPATATPTATPSPTVTPTTPPPTPTQSPTVTPTFSSTPTATPTPTDTPSPSPTHTDTPTNTPQPTSTPTLSGTPAATVPTPTQSPTSEPTATASASPTATLSPSATSSPTLTFTPTHSPTLTASAPSRTPTPSHTATWTMIITVTFPPTRTPTPTVTPTLLGPDTCCQFTAPILACGQATGGSCPSGSTDVRFAACLGGNCVTFTPKTGTPTPTPTIRCGNGIIEAGEDCDPGAGTQPCCTNCKYRPAGSVCDRDGEPCTLDWCNADGQCFQAAPLPSGWNCDRDNNQCTADQCDGAGTCAFVNNLPSGASCDDLLFCNGVDQCDGMGECQHSGNPCPETECNQCNEAADNCFNPAGTPCTSDGLVCTRDQCDGAGVCTHPPLPAPQCATGYAVLGSELVRARLGFGAFSGGSVCSEQTFLGAATFVDGDAVGVKLLSLARSTDVRGKCVTDRPAIFGPGAASPPCTGGQVTHPNPTPPRPPAVDDCDAARASVVSRKNVLLQPTPGIGGPVLVPAGSTTTIDLRGKGSVPTVDSGILTIKRDGVLVIQGDAATQAVILRIASNLSLRPNARIILSGIPDGPLGSPAERILLLVGGKVRLGRNSKVAGTIVAGGDVTIGSFARVDGAVFCNSGKLRFQRGSTVLHAPWVLW